VFLEDSRMGIVAQTNLRGESMRLRDRPLPTREIHRARPW